MNNSSDLTAASAPARKNVSRRSLVAAAAWSTPVILTSVATPAMAASTPTIQLTIAATGSNATVDRCGVIPAGSLPFQTYKNGVPSGVSDPVILSLPQGLRFVGSTGNGMTTTVIPNASGLVQVPAIQAVGTAGTYSITATLGNSTAFHSIDVSSAGAGNAFLVPFAATSGSKSGAVSLSDVRSAATSDDLYAFLDGTGSLFMSGYAIRQLPEQAPVQVLTNVASFDVASRKTNAYYVSVIAQTTDNRIFYSSTVNATPNFVELTGFTGTILEVKTYDGASFVRTTDGVFYNGMNFGAATNSDPFQFLAGSEKATYLTTWAENNAGRRAGGAFLMPSGDIVWFNSTGQAPVTQLVGKLAAPVRSLGAGNSSLIALDVLGQAWVLGDTFNAKTFTKLGSGYSEMATWTRYNDKAYSGVAFIGTDGAVYEAQGAGGTTFAPTKVKGLDGVVVTRVFASDGIYQVLTSDGQIWSWQGNNNIGIGTATQVQNLGPVQDFVASGYHDDAAAFYGWGIALTQSTCQLV